jgi:carbonic anhydrase/acetyltransferase-like protein (isoleucine patch superfamily)
VDPTAILCGLVIVWNVFIGPYAVIRADEMDADGHIDPIVIGAHSSIQDGVVIHSKSGARVSVGQHTRSPIAPSCTPCTVGNGVFIGFNSVLFNCVVDDGCVVRYNAVVDGCHLPPGFYVPSTARIGPRPTCPRWPGCADASDFSGDVVRTNNELVRGYKAITMSSDRPGGLHVRFL